MAVVKVIEVLAQSEKSWEDAAQVALDEVSKTIRGIQSIYVRDLQAIVENDTITKYRLNAKVSFVVSQKPDVERKTYARKGNVETSAPRQTERKFTFDTGR